MIERFHGLIEPWGEPERCPNFARWQERLTWLSQVQRERSPAIGTQSRWAACPALATGVRPYARAHETAPWSVERGKTSLAQGLWPRRVDRVGRITL